MLKKRIAALAAGTVMALSMGATAMAGGVKPYDADITHWDNMPAGNTGKLCILEEPGKNPNGSIRQGDGYIRFSAPDNCGPWFYEDVEEDIKQAFGVQTLEDRGAYPTAVSSSDPYEVRHAWKLVREDPTRTCITLSNGTQVSKPGNGVKIRPGETLYECMSNTWMEIMPGDLNNSGTITVSDLTQWLEVCQMGGDAPTIWWLAADVNGDKDLTLSDLVMLANILQKGPNTRTFDGTSENWATPVISATTTPSTTVTEDNLRMEYEPVYETHRGDICWHCKGDMKGESQKTGKSLDVVRGEHSGKHRDEFLNGTAQRPNYFTYNEASGYLLQQGSYTAWITTQVDVVPAPSEAHERIEYICGVCDLNVTRELIDPEKHRMQHAQDDVEFGGIGFEFYRTERVWVPAA